MFQAVERAIVAEGMCAADAASFVSVCPHVSGCRGRHGWCSLMLRMGRDVCQVLVDERLLAFECLPLATLERALDDGRLPSKYLSLGLLRLATGLRKELTQTKAQLQSAQHRLLQPYECCDPHERIGERIAVLRGSDYHQGIVLGFRAPDHRIAFDGDVNGATLVDLRQVQYRGPAAAPATGRGIGLTPCCVVSPVSHRLHTYACEPTTRQACVVPTMRACPTAQRSRATSTIAALEIAARLAGFRAWLMRTVQATTGMRHWETWVGWSCDVFPAPLQHKPEAQH